MPFGLCNAPATFECLMERVLDGLNWKASLVYLDDVIVLGKTFKEQSSHLQAAVFKRLLDVGLKLNPKKCNLFQRQVKYLGHVVSHKGTVAAEGILRWGQSYLSRDSPINQPKKEMCFSR